jgi:hypothetical protein
MKSLSLIEKVINWFLERNYNCDKGKHKWGYTLSDTGLVYFDKTQVPDDKWKCLNCGTQKCKDLVAPKN